MYCTELYHVMQEISSHQGCLGNYGVAAIMMYIQYVRVTA